jgi:hypothetical protein
MDEEEGKGFYLPIAVEVGEFEGTCFNMAFRFGIKYSAGWCRLALCTLLTPAGMTTLATLQHPTVNF